MQITIIGMGEIGTAIFEDMLTTIKRKHMDWTLYGVDINEELLRLMSDHYSQDKSVSGFSTEVPNSDVYIISVYSANQVDSVIDQIPNKDALIIIEATISPELAEKIEESGQKIVHFPHRYNPGDSVHRVFNIHRLIGATDKEELSKALKFYYEFMPDYLIHVVPFKIAALSKVVENAYRFIEIAIAEDFKMECDRLGIDFEQLREATNTKWNIEIKEARKGIGGKCLPKDHTSLLRYFNESKLLKASLEVDIDYKKKWE